MENIAVVTTFPNNAWDIYAKRMLQSFVQYWPKEIPLLMQLDNDLLLPDVQKILRPQDAIAVGWEKGHHEFVERNKDKDSATDYRFQPVRFCHKIFTLKRALDAVLNQKNDNTQISPRYLIWMDADVLTEQPISLEDIKLCLPKKGDAVSYMGRNDWPHSECGWMAFDLHSYGDGIIRAMTEIYTTNAVIAMEQQHDAWVFDTLMKDNDKKTNLTPNIPGMDVWPHSPMGKWSKHYKGPQAKAKLAMNRQPQEQIQRGGVTINTRNSIPNEQIRVNIEKNQTLIKNWIRICAPTDEEIVVVSAGPMLVAEDLRSEVKMHTKIIAVKHALSPLKAAGITPWACILLDPRPHVADFIDDADPSILWFVASQVNPAVTMELLARGCTVWGYHATVGAGEEAIIKKQEYAVISGGSATATRGLYLLHHLGFSRMRLYGYDLCVPDKPDMNAKDDLGQPKYFEMSVGMNDPLYSTKRMFFTAPELMAQFEELNDIVKSNRLYLEAYGDGVVPFMLNAKRVADLRRKEKREKLAGPNPPPYSQLLGGALSQT